MLPPFAQRNLEYNERALHAAGHAASMPAGSSDAIECLGAEEAASTWTAWIHGPQGHRLTVHSRRNPLQEARTWLDQELAGRPLPELIFIIGAGLGFALDAIIERSSTARVVILEPEPSFARGLLARKDWTSLIEARRLTLVVGPSYAGADAAWRVVTDPDVVPLILVQPVIARERQEAVVIAMRHVQRILADGRSNETARRLFAAPYLLNTLENLPLLLREADVSALVDQFAPTPVIVAAAGPSLDARLEDLRTVRSRAILVAVDTALRPLLHAGIEPDFAVAVDPSETNIAHLLALPDCPGTSLVAETSLMTAAFEGFRDRTFLFRVGNNHPWPWLASQGIDLGTLDAWGSVLVTAVDFAVRIGGNPVVLVGADLAYVNQQPYCRGTAYEQQWTQWIADDVELSDVWKKYLWDMSGSEEGLDGRPCPVAPRFLAFRDGLRDRMAKKTSVRFVNATGAGILTGQNIDVRSLRQVFDGRQPHGVDVPAVVAAARARGRSIDSAPLTSGLLRLLRDVPPEWEQGPFVAPTEAFLCRLIGRVHGRPRPPRPSSWTTQEAERWSEWLDLAEHLRTHAARWQAVARAGQVPLPRWPFERLRALIAAAGESSGETSVSIGGQPAASDVVFGAAVDSASAVADLLSHDRVVHRLLTPDMLRRHLPAGRVPASAAFEWRHSVQASVDRLQHNLATLAREAQQAASPSAFRTTAIRREEERPHPADREMQVSAWTNVDTFARYAVLTEWAGVLSALGLASDEPASDGPASVEPASQRDARGTLVAWLDSYRLTPGPRADAGLALSLTRLSRTSRTSTNHGTIGLGLSPQRAARLLTGRWCAGGDPRTSATASGCSLLAVERPGTNERLVMSLDSGTSDDGDPRTRWFRRPGGWFDVVVLTERGVPRCRNGRSLDAGSAIFAPVHETNRSIRIASDGTWEELAPWPTRIYGEVPWIDGGTLMWGSEGERHVVGHRPAPHADCIIDPVPFWSWNVVTADGRLPMWPTHNGGLWEWMPGQGGRRLADLPSCLSGRALAAGIRFEPSFRPDAPRYPVKRDGHAFVYDPIAGTVNPEPLPVEGPCWSASVANGWTADAYVHADMIRLEHASGFHTWLICYAPFSVAWAGPSLVVTTMEGDVLLFPDLRPKLEALVESSPDA
jgi:hypothetical protein